MSFRERFKHGWKQAKDDARELFKRQGIPDNGSTGSNTPPNAPSHTSAPEVAAQTAATAPDTIPHALSGEATTGRSLTALTTGLLGSATDSLKFGPLQDILYLVEGFANTYMMEGTVKTEYDTLLHRLRTMLRTLETYPEEDISPAMLSEIQDIQKFVTGELSSIGIKYKGKQGGRYRMAKDEEQSFIACSSRIQEYMDKLSIDNRIKVIHVEDEQSKARIRISEMEKGQSKTLVDRLPSSPSAWYKSSAGADLRRRECTPGTRINVLANLLDWAGNTSEGGVYWLNGMAGTGKTTIAYSVCKELVKNSQLGASFFCSRLREECRNVNVIFPSIAYQLAQFSPEFRSELLIVLEKDQDVHHKLLDDQFEALISRPLLAMLAARPSECRRMVVWIDALDECENKDSTKTMLRVLLSKAQDLPVKFVVSSRPEPQIRDQMTEGWVRSGLVLHELDTGEVQTDIETYLREELKPMKSSLGEEHIAALAKKAGVLFIYAATAVRYIGYDDFQSDPMGRLDDILHGPEFQEAGRNEIDQLYMTVLEAALGDGKLRAVERDRRQYVLHTVICAREPLTVKGISELLEIRDVGHIRAALRPLWSVIHVVGGSELVTTLHASFSDFMLDSARSMAYHCDSTDHNRKLAEHCFGYVMRIQPEVNICGLESSHLFDETVPSIKERVEESIPRESLYACQYWADHVEEGKCARNVAMQLQQLLSTRLLLWMEVLNLSGKIRSGMDCMKLAIEWRNQFEADEELVELTRDAKRFVDTFASNPVSQSTPHIYVSMLPFWPKSAPISRYYSRLTRGPVQPEGTALDRRQLAHIATWTFEGSINTMSISPDGLLIALGIGKDVVIVDSSSGRVVKEPLKGHTMIVQSVAFSPDGARILSGGFEHPAHSATIIKWDSQTGDAILGPLQLAGHIDYILYLSFSLDCTFVATGSNDRTVRVWDIRTGRALHSLQTQHTTTSVLFSPDGTMIVALLEKTTFERTIRVWDIQTKDPATISLLTHMDNISSIAFIPNSVHLVYFTSHAVHVWNAQKGEVVLGPIKGQGYNTLIGCSPCGRYVATGSADRLAVRVWDAQSGNLLLGPLEAHTRAINAVTFSPDSSRIISACQGGLVCTWDAHERNVTHTLIPALSNSDQVICVKFSSDNARFVSSGVGGTISIWDAHTGEMIVSPIKPHPPGTTAVDFLGNRVVSASYDETMCVCDTQSGEVTLGPLELGSGMIFSVAYSPDGKLIATGSDERVDVWNAEDGSRVLGPLAGLQGQVHSLQFSPDRTCIVAGSWAHSSNIAIWDVFDGTSVFGTLDGHTNWVMSISYSPNGALIASGSWDNTIIIWDAYTGKKVSNPLTKHLDPVRSVDFSPDSTRLASGSEDGTIRIWDVQTGEIMFEFLHGHENWITSVAYSPDGTRILSLSNDGSVRIHDARSPEERAQLRSESGAGDWMMNKDGWVVDDQSRLLVWVPGDLRRALWWPRTHVMIAPYGCVRLKIDGSRIGESW